MYKKMNFFSKVFAKLVKFTLEILKFPKKKKKKKFVTKTTRFVPKKHWFGQYKIGELLTQPPSIAVDPWLLNLVLG
jgi:hypothetical protein